MKLDHLDTFPKYQQFMAMLSPKIGEKK